METAELLAPEVEALESPVETEQPDPGAQRQADKDYQNWIKGLKEDGDAGKHYRRIKDDFGRLQEIRRLEPKGIDGIRSTYDGIKGIAHGDKTGLEAVTAMRDALAGNQASLEAIQGGNFEELPEETREGVIRMTPALLETLANTNPEAYTAAVLPHFVDALRDSELYSSYRSLSAVLGEKPPSWLTKEQMANWTNDRLEKVLQHSAEMGQWFKAQADRVKEMGGKSNPSPIGTGAEKSDPTGTANPQYWQEKVYPQSNAYAEETFNKELKQWENKLAEKGFRLSKLEKTALAQQFIQNVTKLASGNPDYVSQMGRYNKMKSPDAASVLSVFKGEFNRHAKSVMDSLVQENYGDKFKGGKPGPKPGVKTAPSAPESGVKYVSVKPQRSDIDFQRTPTDWIYQNKWQLKSGAVVQFRP